MPAFLTYFLKKNDHFSRFFYPFHKNLINLAGVIKLRENSQTRLIRGLDWQKGGVIKKVLQTMAIAEAADSNILKKGKVYSDGVLAEWDIFLF